MNQISIGWDIGGAHVKVAVVENQQILAVYQEPCPLWQGLDKLRIVVTKLLKKLPSNAKHAITMTGELVDLFANRDDGVQKIIKTMSKLLRRSEIKIFCSECGLLPLSEIDEDHFNSIASANWMASASFAATQLRSCLFVDIGSTTTDILLCEGGEVFEESLTDYERLISQELVYTGIVRTPVMAVVQAVMDENGHFVPIVAEHFATMADVYRLTGELSEKHDQSPTADGKEKTIEASARRLARMFGTDFYEGEIFCWKCIANRIRKQQIKKIQNACQLQLSRFQHEPRQGEKRCLVGAGIGRFLIQEIAENLNCDYVDFSTLFLTNQTLIFEPADCAPAVAVALQL